MELLQTRSIECPGCGEVVELLVDCSAGNQEYVEDCEVCCRPLVITISIGNDDIVRIEAQCENS